MSIYKPPRSRISTRFMFLLVAVFLIVPTGASHAWNPLKDIQKAAGSVMRGIGGIFGEGLAGFAGPTVTETANALQKVSDKAIKDAESTGIKLIGAVDVAAEKRIAQISDIMTVQIEDVDGRVREHIAKVDEIITNKLGTADIIATRQINNIEVTLVTVVRYASIVALITIALAVLFYFAIRTWRPNSNIGGSFGPNVFAGLLLLATFSGIAALSSSLLKPPSDAKLQAIGNQLVKSYSDSVQSGDLDSAVYFASQFSSLDATDLAPRFLVQFADLQRDLLRRSALFSSDAGNRELVARVSQVSRTWDIVSQGKVPPALTFLRYEVPATASMIAWQNAHTIADQQRAGCVAAGALAEYHAQTSGSSAPAGQASGYVWLAASYVNWLVQTDPSWKQSRIATACADMNEAVGQASTWVTTAAETAAVFVAQSADAPPSVSPVFVFNVASAEFYRTVNEQYSIAVIGDTQYRAYGVEPQFLAAKAIRDTAAQAIVDEWVKFGNVVSSVPDLPGRDIVLASAGLPLGMVARAKNMLVTNRDPANPEPSLQIPARPSVTLGEICNAHFGAIRGLFADKMFEVLCVNQEAVDQRLREFEQALQDAFAGGSLIRANLVNLGTKFEQDGGEMLSLVSNLAACIVEDNTTLSGFKACPDADPERKKRFLDWLKQPTGSTSDGAVPENATRIAMAR